MQVLHVKLDLFFIQSDSMSYVNHESVLLLITVVVIYKDHILMFSVIMTNL